MAATDFIVAIEFGSTKITGLVGKKNADGSINILGYARENSSDCIKKGVIYNLDKTTQKITSIMQSLEHTIQAGIKKVYVGIGGLSLRGLKNSVSRQLDEDTRISQAIIDSMKEENTGMALIDYEILEVEPQEYKIGNNLLTEPVGTTASYIEGNYLNIIARPSVKQNIRQCFLHSGYEIAGFIISPIATADNVLTNNEKRSGCALVDIGHETTSVAIYKNNILRHLCVIPMGSYNITKDICSKKIEEEDAEQLKLKYASAYTEPGNNEEPQESEYTVEGKYTIQAKVLEDIVEARVNEILANVFNQIKLSGYSDNLMAGIVITGGTSSMPNIDTAMGNITKFEKIRIAQSGNTAMNGNVIVPQNGTANTIVGILLAGEENCCRIDPRKGPRLDFDEDIQKLQEETITVSKPIPMENAGIEGSKNAATEMAKEAEVMRETEEPEMKGQTVETGKVEKPEEVEKPDRQDEIIKVVIPSLEERAKECQELIREATQYFFENKYEAALETLAKAKQLGVEAKIEEIESMEHTTKKHLEDAVKLKALKDKQQEEEAERLKKQAKIEKERKEECDNILYEAVELIDKGQYREAQEKLDKAKSYNISETNITIEELEEKIQKSQKHKTGSIFSRFMKKFSDELLDGIK